MAPEGHVHFYLGSDLDSSSVLDWDPDADPQRFASGLGHNFLELFVRLHHQGRPVSLGSTVPDQTRVIVVFPNHEIWNTGSYWRLGLAAKRHRCVMIRSDLHRRFGRIVANSLQVVANPLLVERGSGRRRVFLLPLPQRGLKARVDHAAGGALVMTYKGNPENIPDYLKEQWFLSALTDLNVLLSLDVPSRMDGSDQDWHDFSDADLALLDRHDGVYSRTLHKPPTKLINAWCADVIPVYAPEPAYSCMTKPGHDSLPFDGPHDLLETLARLRREPELLSTLRAGVRQRRLDLPTTAQTVDSYWAVMQSQLAPPSDLRALSAIVQLVPLLIYVRVLRVLKRLRRTLRNVRERQS